MHPLIDPIHLAKIKDLPLLAKTVAQGFLHGVHTSQQRGSGVEFSQYRSYEPGDSLAQVDWKLFARSDKYFVREAERESDIRVWLVLDASASMAQNSQYKNNKNNQAGWNKLQYAKSLLATLAYLAHHQGDAVGLLGVSTQELTYLPANTGQQHWRKLLVSLNNMESGGQFPSGKEIQGHLANLRSQGLVLVVSDFYQQNEELDALISNISSAKTDVVGIQLACQDEIDFPHKGQIHFEDIETGQQRQVSAKQVKQEYLASREKFNQDLKRSMDQKQVSLFCANIDEPLDETLLTFMQYRQRLG